MILPDANLLLYAVDDASPFHVKSRIWLEDILNGVEEVGLCHPVFFAFVRLSTHRKVFESPLSIQEAFELLEEWIARPVCSMIPPTLSHVRDVQDVLLSSACPGGNWVADAQIAATARAYKATVHTADRDFLRFDGIKCHFPLQRNAV